MIRRRHLIAGTAALATPTILVPRSRADARSIQVGIYTAQQGEYVRKQIIPAFEDKYKCRVYTTEGVTLSQIAALRATRSNPKYSVMFMDDIGIDLAKREGLIDRLPIDKLPNVDRLYKRFMFSDGYGAAFAVSTAGWAYGTDNDPKLLSYANVWDDRFRGRMLMVPPRYTQSIYLLVAAASLATGKPWHEAQYLLDQCWGKMAELKPNVLTIYESNATIMMVTRGEADFGGIEYSKNIYPYTVAGAPIDMTFPKEGTFAGINCLSFVKNGPEPELATAFINHMLDPDVQQGLAAATQTAATISGLNFKPDVAKYMAYPESKMDDMKLFACDWAFINPIRPSLLEKYNQIFAA